VRRDNVSKAFRPSLAATILLGGLVLAFIGLGNWQLDRAAQKAAIQQQFDQAPSFDVLPAPGEVSRYAHVRVAGKYDRQRHFLIDNQLLDGRAGVHVLTPFALDDGRTILVNRGWLPLPPDRRSLPAVPTDGSRTELGGQLDEIYRPGRRIGNPDVLHENTWPQLVTYPAMDDIAAVLGTKVYPLVLKLDADEPSGFEGRHWHAVNTGAAKHRARALQWFTFVIAALLIWLYLGFRRGAER